MSGSLILWDELIDLGVKAGFTTAGSDDRFNLALHAGGDWEEALKNRERLCRELDVPFSRYTCAEQIHGTAVTPVGKALAGRGRLSHGDAIEATDALITNEPDILINIFVADCVPIILYDTSSKAGGVCHAGWRGTAGLILMKTVQAMTESYESRPENIMAYIGPSIGGCCYEIGPHVQDEISATFTYEENPFSVREENLYLDLKRANESQLIKAGLKRENIRLSPHCTICSGTHFFSYRKNGDKAGRFSAFFTIHR